MSVAKETAGNGDNVPLHTLEVICDISLLVWDLYGQFHIIVFALSVIFPLPEPSDRTGELCPS